MEGLKIKELALKIMNAAIEKTVCTDNDVFVEFRAHVMILSICVIKGGWKSRKERTEESFNKDIYLTPPFDGYEPEVPVLEELEGILNYINEI